MTHLPSHRPGTFGPQQPPSSPEAERLVQRVAEWMGEEVPGATVYGPAGSGKSTAIARVAACIHQLASVTFTSVVSVPYELPDKPHALAEEWLGQEGVWSRRHTRRHTRSSLLPVLEAHCIIQARARRTNRVLLIVDDAQNLRRRHFDALRALDDGLKRQGCHVFTLLVGQLELVRMAEAFSGEQAQSIVARYFAHRYAFGSSERR